MKRKSTKGIPYISKLKKTKSIVDKGIGKLRQTKGVAGLPIKRRKFEPKND